MPIIDRIVRYYLEGIGFLLIAIFIFNEPRALLSTLSLLDHASTTYIGFLSVLLAANNILSDTFFGIRIIYYSYSKKQLTKELPRYYRYLQN